MSMLIINIENIIFKVLRAAAIDNQFIIISLSLFASYAMLMRPKKADTAVHDY